MQWFKGNHERRTLRKWFKLANGKLCRTKGPTNLQGAKSSDTDSNPAKEDASAVKLLPTTRFYVKAAESKKETALSETRLESPIQIANAHQLLPRNGLKEEKRCLLILKRHDSSLSAALAKACKRNSLSDVELLIMHPSMNTSTSNTWIHAIEAAASAKRRDILSFLLDRAPGDGFVREHMLKEIRRSIGIGAHEIASTIFTKYLEKYSVLGVWNDMQWNDDSLLKFYLGVRPSYVTEVATKTDQTVLHFVLSQWPKVSVLMMVLSAKDVDMEERAHGDTPLMQAARMDETEIVGLLLDRGANISAKDNTGRTALHIAAEQGNTSMVRLLLLKGANASLLTSNGKTAADLSARGWEQQAFNILTEHSGLPSASVHSLGSKSNSRWKSSSRWEPSSRWGSSSGLHGYLSDEAPFRLGAYEYPLPGGPNDPRPRGRFPVMYHRAF